MLRSFQLKFVKQSNLLPSPNLHRKITTANIRRRLLIWETEKERQNCLNIKTQNINISLTDGSMKQGIAGVTTPLECAKG